MSTLSSAASTSSPCGGVDLDLEVRIVSSRSEELMAEYELTKTVNKELVEMLVTISGTSPGQTKDGKTRSNRFPRCSPRRRSSR